MAVDWIRYVNQGATRNLPLNSRLVEAFSFLPEMGLGMEVFSGGQPSHGPNRVGSHRHDDGGAGDVFFTRGGRRLDWANPEDRPIFADIVQRAREAGVTGFGAGPGYMQQGSMHVGFGAPAVWGAGGRGANAPDWLRAAYEGASAPSVAAAAPQPSASPAPVLGPGVVVAERPVATAPAGPGAAPATAASVFGDLIAPQAPASFASIIDNYARRRRAEEEEEQARQARLAALFANYPV